MPACLALLISCEHGGNAIPASLAALFADKGELLASHRGFDAGALDTAKILAQAAGAPLFPATTSRLVVDLNRSIGNPGLFSAITKGLPPAVRQDILNTHYHPHRKAVAAAVARLRQAGQTVLHIASHSFTPSLDGSIRHGDVGFLYDPKRTAEKALCRLWRQELAALDAHLVLRCNYPYRGVTDGLATALRKHFGTSYLGVELEVNQRFVQQSRQAFSDLSEALAEALLRALRKLPNPPLAARSQ